MPQDPDRFILLHHLIELLESASKEAKAQSAHPPELTKVGIPLEDILNVRVMVGRKHAANMKLFERKNADQARAEIEADKAISDSVASERDCLVNRQLTAEAFCQSVYSHDDHMRAARHIIAPRLFYDARDRNTKPDEVEVLTGYVELEASRSYQLTLSPTNVNKEKREIAAFLISREGTCPLFSARDQGSRRILLTEFADDAFQIISMCSALNLNFVANVFIRLRATPMEFRFSGEIEQIVEVHDLRAAISQASLELFGTLPGFE